MAGPAIYLDYNATTPLDPRVIDAMRPCWQEHFGNPASTTHAFGWAAAALVDAARISLARGLGARPDEIVFTSGATEADNLAIKGTAWASRERGDHIVTCATEHKAVLDPCHRLASDGFAVTVVPVRRDGLVDENAFLAALTPRTVLASVMLANNETGVLQPVASLAHLCRERGVRFHCDATQAVGRIPVSLAALGVDLLSCSAHKLYGPRGVGALLVRRTTPRQRLVPLLDGGGHQQGLRSGTLNAPGIVGFARALELCLGEQEAEAGRLAALRDRLRDAVAGALAGVVENGGEAPRLPNTLSLSFAGVDGGALLAGLGSLAVSPGSACTSADPRPSHVLLALGHSSGLARASLRLSLGRWTTEEEVDEAAAVVIRQVTRLRDASPPWRGGRRTGGGSGG